MRITGGKNRGQTLVSPKNMAIRPTSDRVRESLFNILSHTCDFTFDDSCVLDLFCGTGALGLESLSRGASKAVFVDVSRTSLSLAQENAAQLRLTDQCQFILKQARGVPLNKTDIKANLVFADPPYCKNLAPPAIERAIDQGYVANNALIVVEMSVKSPEPLKRDDCTLLTERTYGTTMIKIYRYFAST